jgi:hypothetical protein
MFLVVVWLYLTLVFVTLVFFLSLAHYGSNSRLQHTYYSLLALSFSLSVSTTISDFYFRIQFVDNEFKKSI